MARPKTEIIYENTVPARFVRRINRFTAEVMIDGLRETGRIAAPECKSDTAEGS